LLGERTQRRRASPSGGNALNGEMSGLFNTGVPKSVPFFLGATASGLSSGLFNTGTLISGLFSLESALS
jgi:hypothetical protein